VNRQPFHVRILQQIAKPPTNEALIASDLRVTVPSVRRIVDVFVRQGDVIRIEVEGYPPHLCLTKAGREYLAEKNPNWWKVRVDL
jgi:DNA-binding MarR family transcriptional regulator